MFVEMHRMKNRLAASSTAAALALCCGPAWCQSPASVAPPPQPWAVPLREEVWRLALPPFAGPHQITGDLNLPPPGNLFQQDRDSFRQVRQQNGQDEPLSMIANSL